MTGSETFGRYVLLERIAVGGMAEIFKAKSHSLGGFEKLLVIKRLHPRFSEDEEFIQMLIEEARIAVQLNHPNIAQIFDLDRIGEHYYIAMEYVDGCDLYRILRRCTEVGRYLPIEISAYIAAEVACGLDYAHRKTDGRGVPLNIVHRDVSPQNIIVSWEGEVKLIDFGIAKAAQRPFETESGVIKGKFYYMSPEQARGDRVDHRADIFSTGIVLYEMLTGTLLYKDEDDVTLLSKVRRADIEPPTRIRPDIPRDLERIVMKALARDPRRRYATDAAFREDLLRFLYAFGGQVDRSRVGAFLRELFAGDPRAERGGPAAPPPTATGPSARLAREEYRAEPSSLVRPALQPTVSFREQPPRGGALPGASLPEDDTDETVEFAPPVEAAGPAAAAASPWSGRPAAGVPAGPRSSGDRAGPTRAGEVGAAQVPRGHGPLPAGSFPPPSPSQSPSTALDAEMTMELSDSDIVLQALSGDSDVRPQGAVRPQEQPPSGPSSPGADDLRDLDAEETGIYLPSREEHQASVGPVYSKRLSREALPAVRPSGMAAAMPPPAAPAAAAPVASIPAPAAGPALAASVVVAAPSAEEPYGRNTARRRPGSGGQAGEVLVPDLRHRLAFLGMVGGFLVIGSLVALCNHHVLTRSQEPPETLVTVPGIGPSRGGEAAVQPVTVDATSARVRKTASIQVVSTPSGATVEVGGRLFPGTTPTRVDGLEPGRPHRVLLTLRGHEPWDSTVALAPGEVRTVSATLLPVSGTLLVRSDPPGARVRVGDRDGGETPALVPDLPTDRDLTVVLSLPGYREERRTVTWRGERRVTMDVKLEREVGRAPAPALASALASRSAPPSGPVARRPVVAVAGGHDRPGPSPARRDLRPPATPLRPEPEEPLARGPRAPPAPDAEDRPPSPRSRSRDSGRRGGAADDGTAGDSAPAGAPAATGPAYLSVHAIPWGKVYVDNQILAPETPLIRGAVRPGRRAVKVWYPSLNRFSAVQHVTLEPGEHRKLFFRD